MDKEPVRLDGNDFGLQPALVGVLDIDPVGLLNGDAGNPLLPDGLVLEGHPYGEDLVG